MAEQYNYTASATLLGVEEIISKKTGAVYHKFALLIGTEVYKAFVGTDEFNRIAGTAPYKAFVKAQAPVNCKFCAEVRFIGDQIKCRKWNLE